MNLESFYIFTSQSRDSTVKRRAVYISRNNLERVSGCINSAVSGLCGAEPAVDYLVKQLAMWRLVPWQLLRCENVLVAVCKNSADKLPPLHSGNCRANCQALCVFVLFHDGGS